VLLLLLSSLRVSFVCLFCRRCFTIHSFRLWSHNINKLYKCDYFIVFMITVSILINGHPIYSRSAVNISTDNSQPQKYKVDTGEIIEHNQEDGAVALSHKLLNTIQE